jgi:hypothetical protein
MEFYFEKKCVSELPLLRNAQNTTKETKQAPRKIK